MNLWRGLRHRLRWRADPREEAEEEIRFHLEERTEELIREGLDPARARAEAERRFGTVSARERQLERMIEGRRTARRRAFSLGVWTEALRSAARALRRRPLPAGAAILSLSFGLAAVATIGSLVDELLLRPPAGIAAHGELVYVDVAPFCPGFVAEALDRAAEGHEPRVPLGRHLPGSLLAVRGAGSPERILALGVDGDYFPVLGVTASRGRLLDDADDRSRRPVAVVSSRIARRQLGGGPNAVGEILQIEGRPFTVAGVADGDFGGTFHGFPVDVWLPMATLADLDPTIDLEDPSADAVELVARLPAGLGPNRLGSRLDAALAGLRTDHPAFSDTRVSVHPLTGFDPEEQPFVVRFVSLLALASLGLLAVAASPVALWLIARGVERRRELAIRAALGARRRHLAMLLLAEGGAVGLLGGALGLLVAAPLPGHLLSLLPPLPIAVAFAPEPRAGRLALVLVLAIATGLLASVPGILRLRSRFASGAGLREARGGVGSGPTARRLIVAQLTVTSALLVLAAAFADSVTTALGADPGFDLGELRIVQRLDVGTLRSDPDGKRRFHRELARRASELRGVEAAGLVARFPLSLFGSPTGNVSAPGQPAELDPEVAARNADGATRRVDVVAVDEGFLEAAGIGLLRGRGLLSSDGPDDPSVALVDLDFAEAWFPGANGLTAADRAVGRRLRIDDEIHTIVGVTGATKSRSILEEGRPQVWTALTQRPSGRVDLVLRTGRPAAELADDLSALLETLEPDLPVPRPMSGPEVAAARMLPQRLAALLCIAFGSVGLLLAGFALYALASWKVRAGEREIGVRLGLGATPRAIRRGILAEGLRSAGLGLALGLGFGLLAAHGASRTVPGVELPGPTALVLVAAVLALAALLAGLGPAWRASRVDPSVLLRAET